jgi:LmbE family N-acetylglucosaminyl deacetylase
MHGGQIVTAASLLDRAIEARGRGVLFVGAHPDDETFALGGQLGLLRELEIMIVTDGAPRDMRDAREAGFSDARQYAAARRAELTAALEEAGIPPSRLTMLGITDQQACRQLIQITRTIVTHIAGHNIGLLLTHAYEGGHPDHDAVALATHAARQLLPQTGVAQPPIVEMPYYRSSSSQAHLQEFAPGGGIAVHEIELSEEQFALKQRMIARHKSQFRLLGGFSSRVERFRLAPDYNFRRPPNDGELLYESWQLGVTGSEWLQHANTALDAMEMER